MVYGDFVAPVRSAIFFSVLKFFFTSSWSGKYDFDCGRLECLAALE